MGEPALSVAATDVQDTTLDDNPESATIVMFEGQLTKTGSSASGIESMRLRHCT